MVQVLVFWGVDKNHLCFASSMASYFPFSYLKRKLCVKYHDILGLLCCLQCSSPSSFHRIYCLFLNVMVGKEVVRLNVHFKKGIKCVMNTLETQIKHFLSFLYSILKILWYPRVTIGKNTNDCLVCVQPLL